ncbi:MAG: hypothetical protein V1645_03155, partial [archaeon]
SYSFNNRKSRIMEVFLVKASMKQPISLSKNPKKEHDGYLWVDKKTAVKTLTWPNARKIIKAIKIK